MSRARDIAAEIPLTWRQVVWTINQVVSGATGGLHHWLETAHAQEVAAWVWDQWVCQECDRDY